MISNIEVVHPDCVVDLDREQKLEAKKWALRQSLGDERYERWQGLAKSFFEANKKEMLRYGSAGIHSEAKKGTPNKAPC